MHRGCASGILEIGIRASGEVAMDHFSCNCTFQGRALTPCGRTRREFLWQAGGGFVGTALTYLLAQDGFLPRALAGKSDPSPLDPRQPHFPAKAKSCIFLFMYGGPSQVDLWDPKPNLAKHHGQPIPDLDKDPLFKVRNPGTLLASSHKFLKSGKSGIEVSDLYPHLAQCVDDM